jgi:MFS family permease
MDIGADRDAGRASTPPRGAWRSSFTGAWSDRVGRKWLIATGMWVQAVGIALVVVSRASRASRWGGVLLGVGTAMVYPTLLAAIGDVAHPSWRASSVGVYRLWRDLGLRDRRAAGGPHRGCAGPAGALWITAALTFLSGLVVASTLEALTDWTLWADRTLVF